MSHRAVTIISKSRSIFRNLAFEDWLFTNEKFENCDRLLIWRNGPSVVIGRHQNPWMEADVPFLKQKDIALVRRKSGGGAVYHDFGNLNLSFMTSKNRHKREKNLSFICSSLNERFHLNLELNKRHDLVLPGDRKISGTAAKISRDKAYHHLTLLVQVDKSTMSQALKPTKLSLNSRATKSVRSLVGCLTDENQGITVENVTDAICNSYANLYESHSLSTVYPSEQLYSGLDKIGTEFRDWSWIFGHTPKFECMFETDGRDCVQLTIEKGLVTVVGDNYYCGLIGRKFDTVFDYSTMKLKL